MDNQTMQDKELMMDMLSTQKLITSVYSSFANECACKSVRDDFLNMLREEHDIQADIYKEMSNRGWYAVQPAEQQKIAQAKQKFPSGAQ